MTPILKYAQKKPYAIHVTPRPNTSKMNVSADIQRSLKLLKRFDRVKLYLFIFLQLLLSILDTCGILLIGAVTSISISVVSDSPTNPNVVRVLNFIGLQDASQENSIAILGAISIFFLLLKTFLSLVLSFVTYRFLAKKAAEVSTRLMRTVFNSQYSWTRKIKSQEVSYTLTEGVQYAIVGVLSSFIVLVSEAGLLVIILTVLSFVNFEMALVSIGFFSFFGAIIYYHITKRIGPISEGRTDAAITGLVQINDVINLYKEIRILGRMEFFSAKFQSSRLKSTALYADQNWIQQVPRLSVEFAIVLGAAGLAITSLISSEFSEAIPNLIIFLAAASRLAPSALRLQQSAIAAKSYSRSAGATFQYECLDPGNYQQNSDLNLQVQTEVRVKEPSSEVSLTDLCFKFEDSEDWVLKGINLHINPREFIAIVGPSGSGKSTLCEIILGLQSPNSGTIEIGKLPVAEYLNGNRGKVALLPQDVKVLSDSVLSNIAIGIPESRINMERILEVIESSQLADFVRSQQNGLAQKIGESGIQLSGGQRQRLGLARALYSNPELIILDEPTSALDAETEDLLMQSLIKLKKQCTIIIVAHRLSTIRFADRVVYLENGKILGDDTFHNLRTSLAKFDLQADLQGL
jgi:ABC-type bacteriocin/lantibiotic exporter with double-glycine peptidase domain